LIIVGIVDWYCWLLLIIVIGIVVGIVVIVIVIVVIVSDGDLWW